MFRHITKFVSQDGIEFDDRDECVKHEMELSGLKMWGYSFNQEVVNAYNAGLVYCKTNEAVELFYKLCEYTGRSTKGISLQSTGWYIIAPTNCSWTYINRGFVDIIRGTQ